MGCCEEKQMVERLQVLNHALVLACQQANINKTQIAVVTLTHHHYGEYYKGIDYDQAKAEGYTIHRKFKLGDSMKKVKTANEQTTKHKARRKLKPGDTMAV